MEIEHEAAAGEVLLFLDDGDLYVTGEPGAVDLVVAELLGSDVAGRRRSTSALSDAAAVGTIAAAHRTSEELLRPTAESLKKLRKFDAQFDNGTGALRGFVRDERGRFAGNLAFESVSFGAEQVLAMQTAAVSLALRSAIADVQAAVEAVDRKVSDIQKRVRAREVGEVVGTYRHLQQVVDATRARGHLLDADWDQVAGARRDLEVALESLRAYVTDSITAVDAEDSLPKREEAVKRIASSKEVAGSLRLILVAEQALHLAEYLRLERVRTTDPGHVSSALEDARRSLRGQRERDAELVRVASERIEAAKRIDPLEIHRVFSFAGMRDASSQAFEALDMFAASSRAVLPELDREVHRPALSETRDELKRHAVTAKDGAVDVSRTVGRTTARGARKVTEKVRDRSRDLLD